MLVKTRHFGELDLEESKIITFEQGILGFEAYKKYTLLYDIEKQDASRISWLQSVEEPSLALPVISPECILSGYNPIINEERIRTLGEIGTENLVILLTLTVPGDLTKMTTNLKAPILIHTETKKGCQIVAENPEYIVKYNVYDLLKNKAEKKGE